MPINFVRDSSRNYAGVQQTLLQAEISQRRISHHPRSFDELIDLLHAGPVITPEVDAFMADYLAAA